MKLTPMKLLPILMLATSVHMVKAAQGNTYIEGTFGQSFVDEKNVTGVVNTDNSFGWNTSLGYILNSFISLEAGYTEFATGKVTYHSHKGTDEHKAYDAIAKITWTLNPTIQLFSKLGAGYLTSSLSDELVRANGEKTQSNLSLWYGIGASYKVNNAFSLMLEGNAITPGNDLGVVSLVSFGGRWRFGAQSCENCG